VIWWGCISCFLCVFFIHLAWRMEAENQPERQKTTRRTKTKGMIRSNRNILLFMIYHTARPIMTRHFQAIAYWHHIREISHRYKCATRNSDVGGSFLNHTRSPENTNPVRIGLIIMIPWQHSHSCSCSVWNHLFSLNCRTTTVNMTVKIQQIIDCNAV